LESISSVLSEAVRRFTRRAYVRDADVEALVRDIQRSLLKADVPVDLVKELSDGMREAASKESPGLSKKDVVVKSVYEGLVKLVGGEQVQVKVDKKPAVWLFVGIQGFGKTTSLAKLALLYEEKGSRVAVVCADTFRPGALEQIRTLLAGKDIQVVGGSVGDDPATLLKHTTEELRNSKPSPDIIMVDTAGRHKTQDSLMQELSEIVRVAKPDATFLVVDAALGQAARSQAEAFNSLAPIGYVVVTKMDGTARGGGALAAVASTGAKIAFIGTGEKISELRQFNPTEYISDLMGVPDLKTILERVSRSMGAMGADRVKAFALGRFTLEEFVDQMEEVTKGDMASMLLKLLPTGAKVPKETKKMTEQKVKVWRSVLNSMNKEERNDPSLMDQSRIRRVAVGSGRSEREVRELLQQYKNSRKMVKRVRGMRGLKGLA
jgi:signal recognition particle subunit SRP54